MTLRESVDRWEYRRLLKRINKYEKYIAKVKFWLKENKKQLRKLKWKLR